MEYDNYNIILPNNKKDFMTENKGYSLTGAPLDLIEMFRYPVCIIRRDGEIEYRNQSFKDFTRDGDNNITLDLQNPIAPMYRKRLAQAYVNALDGYEKKCFAVMRSANNEQTPVEIYLFPLFEGEEVTKILVFFRFVENRLISFDGTTAMMLEGDDNQYNPNLFEFSPFPILRIDINGEILKISASSEALFGLTREEISNDSSKIVSCISTYDYQKFRKAFESIIDGKLSFKRLSNIKVLNHKKQERWINILLYPLIQKNKVLSIELICEDITRQRVMEEQLNYMHHIQMISDLSHGLLHSLNNINNVIISRTQMLLQITEKKQVLEGLQSIEVAALECVKQIKLVQDFISEGGVTYDNTTFNLVDLIDDLIEFIKIVFKVESRDNKRKIRIQKRYFSLVQLTSNIRLMREIFLSMLYRVASCITREGIINIEIKDSGGELYVWVMVEKDVIQQDDEHDELTAKKQYSSSQDIRRMAEKVNVRIIEEESATVYSLKAVLPYTMLTNKVKDDQTLPDFKLRDLDILVVDDEEALTRVMFELFDRMGNRVHVCKNGLEALKEFKLGKFDLVLSDYDMGDITGIELLTRIKELNDKVVTVLFSGWSLNDLKPYDNIVDLYLDKPFQADVLIKSISKTMAMKRKQ